MWINVRIALGGGAMRTVSRRSLRALTTINLREGRPDYRVSHTIILWEEAVNIHAESSSEPANDILELGTALVAATPQFSETVRRLTGNSAHVSQLVQATLRAAWLSRQGYSCKDTVHDWLVVVLRRQILH